MFAELPVLAIDRDPATEVAPDPRRYPWRIPAVADLLSDGLTLGPLTVLVGENGSGKSTLVEAIAQAYGLSPEGGSTGARHTTRTSESELHRALRIRRGIGASRWGFFLRAETMHGFYTYLESDDPKQRDPKFHDMSHGESFLELLGSPRFADPGFFVLDEPESALSFSGCLALVGLLHRIAADGRRQALIATHSPVIAATPGARIVEVSDAGIQDRSWDELELVENWRDFLSDPAIFLRYVLAPPGSDPPE